MAYAQKSEVDFPVGAMEVKAHWTIDGAKTEWGALAPVQPDMYQLKIDQTQYGLDGMHIMAKIAPSRVSPVENETPSWFWTTFEYKNNPGRSDALRFVTHRDALSPDEARALLAEAGLKDRIADSYECNGTQIHFVDPETDESGHPREHNDGNLRRRSGE